MKQNAFFLLLLSCCFLGPECFHFVLQLARLPLFYLPFRFRLLREVFPPREYDKSNLVAKKIFFSHPLSLLKCPFVLLCPEHMRTSPFNELEN